MQGDSRLRQHFGTIIGQLRTQKGVSQQVVADHCEFERAYISRLERGISEPSITTVFKIAGYFSLTPGELLDKVYLLNRRGRKS
jgi:transcriptional regulator with XRE-family HTH domain